MDVSDTWMPLVLPLVSPFKRSRNFTLSDVQSIVISSSDLEFQGTFYIGPVYLLKARAPDAALSWEYVGKVKVEVSSKLEFTLGGSNALLDQVCLVQMPS